MPKANNLHKKVINKCTFAVPEEYSLLLYPRLLGKEKYI
jgi:hypothetical protein